MNYLYILYGIGVIGLVNVVISGVLVSDKIKHNATFRKDGVDELDPDPPFIPILLFLLSLLFFLGILCPMMMYLQLNKEPSLTGFVRKT